MRYWTRTNKPRQGGLDISNGLTLTSAPGSRSTSQVTLWRHQARGLQGLTARSKIGGDSWALDLRQSRIGSGRSAAAYGLALGRIGKLEGGKMSKRRTIVNEFHNTATVLTPGEDGRISESQARRVRRKLCGIQGCKCGDEIGARPRVVDQEHTIWDYHGHNHRWALVDEAS